MDRGTHRVRLACGAARAHALSPAVVLAALLAVVLAFSMSLATSRQAKADTEQVVPSRAIAIAYDNSGSMFDSDASWNSALYGLEVLAAMLDPADTLSVYTMTMEDTENHPDVVIDGSMGAAARAQTMHGAQFGSSGGTYVRPVEEAYRELASASADEKYLIITTDGAFDSSEMSRLDSTIQTAARDGMTVIYMAIGPGSYKITPDEAHGIYLKVADSSTILRTMTEVANQVFGRAVLPAQYVDTGAGTLHLDVPMSKIIVFAQGSQVSVGDITDSAGASLSGEAADVRYVEVDESGLGAFETSGIIMNPNLRGRVVIFDALLGRGDYSLPITGAEDVAVYYVPYADIQVTLTDDDHITHTLSSGQTSDLSSGNYDVSFSVIDPFTGEPLQSDLFRDAVYSLEITDGTGTHTIDSSMAGQPFKLEAGEVTFQATAGLPAGVRVSQRYTNIEVVPEGGKLSIDVTSVPRLVNFGDIPTVVAQVTVTKADGKPYLAEEWSASSMHATSAAGLPWTVTPTDQVGVYEVSMGYINNYEDETYDALFPGFLGLRSLFPVVADVTFEASALTVDGGIIDGRAVAPMRITIGGILGFILDTLARWWPYYLAILIALIIIIALIRKPRLPKTLNPSVIRDSDPAHVYAIAFRRRDIRNRWFPFGPQRVSFSFSTDAANGPDLGNLSGLDRIGLVAVKRKGRTRRFKLDKDTISTIKQLNADRDPSPAITPAGDTALTVKSKMTFTAMERKRGRRRPVEESYTVRFGD